MLAYQFVAGLTPALRTKIAGVEGNFDQLLVKARFEEAKIRDLSPRINLRNQQTPTPRQPEPTGRTEASVRPSSGGRQDRKQTGKRCYSCNGTGHFQKNCPLKEHSDPVETPGTGQSSNKERITANLQRNTLQQAQDKVAQLRRELMAAEREESVTKAAVTTHVLQSYPETKKSSASGGPTLGPTLKVKASVKGCSTEALIDTSSPVSLVSIDFLLHALIKNMDSGATQEHITKTLKARLEDPQLTVSNFGGDKVNVVGQATVTLCCGEHTSQVTLTAKSP